MKTKLLHLALLILLISVMFGCKNTDYCDSCRTELTSDEKAALDEALHPQRKILCSEIDSYQFFHSDLLNGFEIVGMTTKCENGVISEIKFDLMEVGNCKRYKIDNVEWIETDKFEGYTHHLKFTINTIDKRNDDTANTFSDILKFEVINLTKISIDSNDSGVVIPPVISDPNNYGPIACPVYILGGK